MSPGSSSRKRDAAGNLGDSSSPRQSKIAKATHPFFLKASEKASATFVWKKTIGNTCLHGVHLDPPLSSKVAAYDLDGTLIKTRSGSTFPRDKNDWMWWRTSVKQKIMEMHKEGYTIVIFSNQASAKQKTINEWKLKIPALANELSNVPFRIFAAQQHDAFRKPMPGMWTEFKKINQREIDMEVSYYVGDAAGRPGDHSDSDRKWALNVGLPFFTPEEHFLKSNPIAFKLSGFNASLFPDDLPQFTPTSSPLIPTASSRPEVVLFIGYPASGKSSLYRKFFQPAGYQHVNQDTLKTRSKCVKAVEKFIAEGSSCVVDNTNRDVVTRKEYVDICRKFEVPIRCLIFSVDIQLCWHNNLYRAFCNPAPERSIEHVRSLLPPMAFTSFRANYEEPTLEEGFTEIKQINFRFEGTEEERRRWNMWLDIGNNAWLTSGP